MGTDETGHFYSKKSIIVIFKIAIYIDVLHLKNKYMVFINIITVIM